MNILPTRIWHLDYADQPVAVQPVRQTPLRYYYIETLGGECTCERFIDKAQAYSTALDAWETVIALRAQEMERARESLLYAEHRLQQARAGYERCRYAQYEHGPEA